LLRNDTPRQTLLRFARPRKGEGNTPGLLISRLFLSFSSVPLAQRALRDHAFSLAGPIVTAVLFREIFSGVGADAPDLEALARQHGQALLHGMLRPRPPNS
jgi:hypothetical protein